MPTKIFVGNIAPGTTSAQLSELFKRHGAVTECDVLGLGNYGFVHMANESDAARAIEGLKGFNLNGSDINVEKSTKTTQGRGQRATAGGRSGVGGGLGRGGGHGDPGAARVGSQRRATIKIFIGNLKTGVTDEDLRGLFEAYGTVTEANVCGGFGFVHMLNESEAKIAMSELNGHNLRGGCINVELSTKETQGRSSGDINGGTSVRSDGSRANAGVNGGSRPDVAQQASARVGVNGAMPKRVKPPTRSGGSGDEKDVGSNVSSQRPIPAQSSLGSGSGRLVNTASNPTPASYSSAAMEPQPSKRSDDSAKQNARNITRADEAANHHVAPQPTVTNNRASAPDGSINLATSSDAPQNKSPDVLNSIFRHSLHIDAPPKLALGALTENSYYRPVQTIGAAGVPDNSSSYYRPAQSLGVGDGSYYRTTQALGGVSSMGSGDNSSAAAAYYRPVQSVNTSDPPATAYYRPVQSLGAENSFYRPVQNVSADNSAAAAYYRSVQQSAAGATDAASYYRPVQNVGTADATSAYYRPLPGTGPDPSSYYRSVQALGAADNSYYQPVQALGVANYKETMIPWTVPMMETAYETGSQLPAASRLLGGLYYAAPASQPLGSVCYTPVTSQRGPPTHPLYSSPGTFE